MLDLATAKNGVLTVHLRAEKESIDEVLALDAG